MRLGAGKEDAQQIKDHEWFEPIDWEQMSSKSLKPPFVPYIKSDIDTRHFDAVT